MTRPKIALIKVRLELPNDDVQHIAKAANACGESLERFITAAAEMRAREVLREATKK
jgi:uncharacterized protein (DUF1778 family)